MQVDRQIPSPPDPYLHLRIRRSTLNAVLGSLVLHALVLFVVPQQRVGAGALLAKTGEALVVKLRARASPQTEKSSSVTVAETGPQSREQYRHTPTATPIVALNKSRTKDLSKSTSSAIPPAPQPAATETPTDMLAYVNAARARRRAAGGSLDRETAEPISYEQEPSENEIRMAKVKRNLSSGTNGVFQILSMESRTAAFSFRGWTTDASNSRREYIQVEIGANVDIEIAIVRKMIELIRRYFKGNFNWESQRLDRVVILSARLEDNDGLEGFLTQEFFGARSRTTQVR